MRGSESTTSRISELLDMKPFPSSREAASQVRKELDEVLSAEIPKYTSEDTSLVVFGLT